MAKSSKQFFIDLIVEIVVDLYLSCNKRVDRKSVEEYFSRLIKSKEGRRKLISLLNSYKKSSMRVVDKERVQHALELIFLVYAEE